MEEEAATQETKEKETLYNNRHRGKLRLAHVTPSFFPFCLFFMFPSSIRASMEVWV